jgi:hypothetical protein
LDQKNIPLVGQDSHHNHQLPSWITPWNHGMPRLLQCGWKASKQDWGMHRISMDFLLPEIFDYHGVQYLT